MRWIALSLASAFVFAACGKEEPVRSETSVVRTIELRKADGDVASGMDIDGITSDEHDGRTCFKKDFVGEDGTPGIDNQLATLIPLVDLTGEGALQGLLQNAINEGRLLVLIEMEQMDDGTVNLTVRRGDDTPLLGTDGYVLSGQTIALHAEPMLGIARGGRIVDRTVTSAPFALTFPVIVFSNLYLLNLPDARVRFELTEEGHLANGVIAGTASVEQLLGLVKQASTFGADFESLLDSALSDAADLERDMATGKCAGLSAAINFDAVPAYIF